MAEKEQQEIDEERYKDISGPVKGDFVSPPNAYISAVSLANRS